MGRGAYETEHGKATMQIGSFNIISRQIDFRDNVQPTAKKLAVDSDDGSTNPNNNKNYGEDYGGLVMGFHTQHYGKRHADKEWTPQVPIAQFGTHFAL